jgi:hypothetical protein
METDLGRPGELHPAPTLQRAQLALAPVSLRLRLVVLHGGAKKGVTIVTGCTSAGRMSSVLLMSQQHNGIAAGAILHTQHALAFHRYLHLGAVLVGIAAGSTPA